MWHQDWDPVIIRGKGKHVEAKKKRQGETETRSKFDGTHSSAMRKLDDANEVQKPQRINPAVRTKIVQARAAKKMTQKDLAMKAQITPALVQQYEAGKVKADVNILRKMERALGTKLTGKEFTGINV
jgi:putative transcription factor